MRVIDYKKTDNKGTTLIETLAAFTVLAAIMAILFQIVDFSSRLRTQAVDSAHLNQMFLREIYKNDDKIDKEFVDIKYYGADAGAESVSENSGVCRFWLVLDTEKTDDSNYLGVKTAPDPSNPPRFRLDNFEATVYTCMDPLIEEEQLPIPSALRFRYVSPEVNTP